MRAFALMFAVILLAGCSSGDPQGFTHEIAWTRTSGGVAPSLAYLETVEIHPDGAVVHRTGGSEVVQGDWVLQLDYRDRARLQQLAAATDATDAAIIGGPLPVGGATHGFQLDGTSYPSSFFPPSGFFPPDVQAMYDEIAAQLIEQGIPGPYPAG